MRAKSLIVSSMALAAVAFVAAHAEAGDRRGGASSFSPGHEMQVATPPTGPGASQYAPGDQMRDLPSQSTTSTSTTTTTGGITEPGASGFAPGDTISKGKK